MKSVSNKKSFILYSFICIFVVSWFASCSCSPKTKNNSVPSTEEVYGILPVRYTYNLDIRKIDEHIENSEISKIMKFFYDGHSYINFGIKDGNYTKYSVVHDPDCGCNKLNYSVHDTIYISQSNHIIHDTLYIVR